MPWGTPTKHILKKAQWLRYFSRPYCQCVESELNCVCKRLVFQEPRVDRIQPLLSCPRLCSGEVGPSTPARPVIHQVPVLHTEPCTREHHLFQMVLQDSRLATSAKSTAREKGAKADTRSQGSQGGVSCSWSLRASPPSMLLLSSRSSPRMTNASSFYSLTHSGGKSQA